jgi:hypothetical protein
MHTEAGKSSGPVSPRVNILRETDNTNTAIYDSNYTIRQFANESDKPFPSIGRVF